MANTTFNTRLKLKYDTYANWTANNPVLLAGEVGIVVIPASTNAQPQEPVVMMKVGDGTTAFNALPFTGAVAADVYDWAKAATKPAYTANEITGLEDYISGKVQDTNTQYKVEVSSKKPDENTVSYSIRLMKKDIGDSDWSYVNGENEEPSFDINVTSASQGSININGIEVPVAGLGSAAYTDSNAYDTAGAAEEAENNAKSYADEKIGTVATGKTVVDMIADAQEAAIYDDTALAGRVTTAEGKITTLVGTDTDKSVRTIANEELAKQLIPENAKDSLDTLSEIAAWIQAHPDDASTMNAKISALEGKVGDSNIGDQIDAKINALDLANTYDAKGAASTAETNAKSYADGLAGNYDAAGAADTAKTEAITAAADDAASKYVAKVEGKGLSTNDYTTEEKTKLAGIEEGAQVNKIESIEVNGNEATISEKKASVTVKIEDLAQTDYIIFDCGSSSLNTATPVNGDDQRF